MIRGLCFLLTIAALAAALPAQAQTQNWPSRFVRLVVPGGSGTAADVSARIIAQGLSERWGQQVVVENRPGAGGVAGTVHIAQSAPDGYSLLFAQGAPLSLTPHAFKSVPYDMQRDFEPIIFASHGGARHAGGVGAIHPRRFSADGAHPQGRQPAARGLDAKVAAA